MSLMTVIDGATVAPAKLAEALAKAQAKIRNPSKTSVNPHFKSKYTNLATGIDAVRAALSDNGLSVTQTTDFEGELLVLYTRLLHSSGEWIGSRWPVGAFTKMTQQQIGSALTYSRRYSLFSLVGISGDDEDDDGNAASSHHEAHPAPPIPPTPPQGKRALPKNWMEETKKLFDGAPTYEKLNSSHDKLLKSFHFDHLELDQVEALLMESAKKFFEENENA